MAKDTVTRYEELDRSYTRGQKLRRIFVDREGTDLAAWLEARQGELEGKRLLYIIRPRLDRDVFKFGVQAGARPGRLAAYLHAYGTGGECQTRRRTRRASQGCRHGVLLYGLWGTRYDRDVQMQHSAVYVKEALLKRALRRNTARVGRGGERTTAPLSRLLALVESSGLSHDRRTPVEVRRRTLRRRAQAAGYRAQQEQAALRASDRVVAVLGHRLNAQRKSELEVRWNRPYVVAGGRQVFTARETFEHLAAMGKVNRVVLKCLEGRPQVKL